MPRKETIQIWRRRLSASAALLLASAVHASAQGTTFSACYVPDVGAVYMIGIEGLPEGCISSSHVPFSWTDGSAEALPDGSITTEKIADGAVTARVVGEGAVTASKLATITKRSSEAVLVGNGATGTAEVACEADEILLTGGGGFLGGEMDAAVAFSGDVNGLWKVHGINRSGTTRTLEAQVFCLAAG